MVGGKKNQAYKKTQDDLNLPFGRLARPSKNNNKYNHDHLEYVRAQSIMSKPEARGTLRRAQTFMILGDPGGRRCAEILAYPSKIDFP